MNWREKWSLCAQWLCSLGNVNIHTNNEHAFGGVVEMDALMLPMVIFIG